MLLLSLDMWIIMTFLFEWIMLVHIWMDYAEHSSIVYLFLLK